jgi:hypothetical protein
MAEKAMSEQADNLHSVSESDSVPVCLRCLTPHEPLQHYCDKCGEAVGTLTPYVPFVNIRFNYSIFGTMWRRMWYVEGVPIGWKIFYGVLILLFVPIMLIGLPFVICAKVKQRRALNE